MQAVLTERTVIYIDTNAHNMENIDQTLTQFQLRTWELTSQEELMTNLYNETIKQKNNTVPTRGSFYMTFNSSQNLGIFLMAK